MNNAPQVGDKVKILPKGSVPYAMQGEVGEIIRHKVADVGPEAGQTLYLVKFDKKKLNCYGFFKHEFKHLEG